MFIVQPVLATISTQKSRLSNLLIEASLDMAAGCLPCVYHVGTFPGVFTGISPDLVTTRDALGEGNCKRRK